MPKVWLCLTSPVNYEICEKLKLWGVKDKTEIKTTAYAEEQINQTRIGDTLLFYVTENIGIISICEVLSEPRTEEKDVGWENGLYRRRIDIKINKKLSPIKFSEFSGKLTNIKMGQKIEHQSGLQWKSMIPINPNGLDRLFD